MLTALICDASDGGAKVRESRAEHSELGRENAHVDLRRNRRVVALDLLCARQQLEGWPGHAASTVIHSKVVERQSGEASAAGLGGGADAALADAEMARLCRVERKLERALQQMVRLDEARAAEENERSLIVHFDELHSHVPRLTLIPLALAFDGLQAPPQRASLALDVRKRRAPSPANVAVLTMDRMD